VLSGPPGELEHTVVGVPTTLPFASYTLMTVVTRLLGVAQDPVFWNVILKLYQPEVLIVAILGWLSI
jgi:hypothetical protein